MPNKIKKYLNKGKSIDKQWNNNEINFLINDCVNIEDGIKTIDKLKENLKKVNNLKEKYYLTKRKK